MNDEDLSTTDVLADRTKNLSNFYLTNDNSTDDVDDNDDNTILLYESLYFTESEFADFTVEKNTATPTTSQLYQSILLISPLSSAL